MTISLLSLRLNVVEADGLRWFFCQGEAELGLQSGMGLQLERARVAGGRNKGSKPLGNARAKDLSDDQMEAALSFSRISRRLDQLGPWSRTVLRVHYGPLLPQHRQHEPTHVGANGDSGAALEDRPLKVFEPHLALVLWLASQRGCPISTVIEVARRAKESKGQRQESARAKVQAWLREAEEALVQASAAYESTRPGSLGVRR
jgi:hypothetical protein